MKTGGQSFSIPHHISAIIMIGPSRLRNMYFTYLLLLRALVRGAPLWQRGFHTGDIEQDRTTERLVREIIVGSR